MGLWRAIIDNVDMDAIKARYLELLFDHEHVEPGQSMDSQPFLLEESGLSVAAALGVVRSLRDAGLVTDASGMGNPAAFLLDGGRSFVLELRARRRDPGTSGHCSAPGSVDLHLQRKARRQLDP